MKQVQGRGYRIISKSVDVRLRLDEAEAVHQLIRDCGIPAPMTPLRKAWDKLGTIIQQAARADAGVTEPGVSPGATAHAW